MRWTGFPVMMPTRGSTSLPSPSTLGHRTPSILGSALRTGGLHGAIPPEAGTRTRGLRDFPLPQPVRADVVSTQRSSRDFFTSG